jgi:Domain of unknown function (DUF4198)
MPTVRLFAATCVLGLVAARLPAHDTWLLATPGGAVDKALRFHLTSGGAFPTPEHGIERGRVAASGLRVGGKALPLRALARRADVLVFQAAAGAGGLATAWVALRERVLELTAAQVAEYLDEIGEADRIGGEWDRRRGPKLWRETYRKHAKAFVAVSDAAADGSWREPVALDLEIVPEASPVGLRAGDTLRVRVLKKGAPLPALPIRAARAGSAGAVVRTDGEGRASFRLDAPGPWLLAGTELRESPVRPGEWESDFTTLTLQVGP